MTEKLQKISQREFAKLPKEMQEAISNIDWAKISEGICRKHNLNESETNDVQTEIVLVLAGLVDGNFLAVNLENQVNLTKEEAEGIAKEAFVNIFYPLITGFQEKVKKANKDKNSTWEQNVNFIMSGGDYAAFIDSPTRTEEEKTDKLIGTSDMQKTKRELLE